MPLTLQIGFLCGGDAGTCLIDAITHYTVAFALTEMHGKKHFAQVVVIDTAVATIIHPHAVPSGTTAVDVITDDDRAGDA